MRALHLIFSIVVSLGVISCSPPPDRSPMNDSSVPTKKVEEPVRIIKPIQNNSNEIIGTQTKNDTIAQVELYNDLLRKIALLKTYNDPNFYEIEEIVLKIIKSDKLSNGDISKLNYVVDQHLKEMTKPIEEAKQFEQYKLFAEKATAIIEGNPYTPLKVPKM